MTKTSEMIIIINNIIVQLEGLRMDFV